MSCPYCDGTHSVASPTYYAVIVDGQIGFRRHPIPEGWPDVFDLEAAEACLEVTGAEMGDADRETANQNVADLTTQLRWAIAQLRAERCKVIP